MCDCADEKERQIRLAKAAKISTTSFVGTPGSYASGRGSQHSGVSAFSGGRSGGTCDFWIPFTLGSAMALGFLAFFYSAEEQERQMRQAMTAKVSKISFVSTPGSRGSGRGSQHSGVSAYSGGRSGGAYDFWVPFLTGSAMALSFLGYFYRYLGTVGKTAQFLWTNTVGVMCDMEKNMSSYGVGGSIKRRRGADGAGGSGFEQCDKIIDSKRRFPLEPKQWSFNIPGFGEDDDDDEGCLDMEDYG